MSANQFLSIRLNGTLSQGSILYSASLHLAKKIAMIPTKEENYLRNNGEIIAPDLTSARILVRNGMAIEMGANKTIYHRQGTSTGYNPNENIKIVSKDGKIETVYNSKGEIVTDPVNQGTNNRADPNNDWLGHLFADMLPYYLWGNSPDDPTTPLERVFASYKGDVNITKVERSKIATEQMKKRQAELEKFQEKH